MRSGCEIVLNEGNPSVGSFHNPTATDSTPTTLIMTPEGNVTVSNSRSENPQGNSGDDDYRGEDSEVESDDEDRCPTYGYGYPVEEVWSKFTQKYSKPHSESMILHD